MFKPSQKDLKIFSTIACRTPSVKPFLNDTPAKKRERVRQVRQDDWDAFSFFCTSYFPHIFKLPFCDAHSEMFDVVEKHSGITAITGFRGLGKTVLMGVVYPIWRIVRGEKYVIHTAADADLAEERTAFTYNELTNNKRLLGDFDELRPLDTTESDFFLRNRTRIRARGVKQSFRGSINPRTSTRPGLIVCDDIDKEENVGNQTIGRRRMDKIVQEIGGALDPSGSGKVIWLGNLVHPNYAICQFAEAIIDEIKTEKASFDPDSVQHLFSKGRRLLRFPLETGDGKSAWEKQYPTSALPLLRQKFGLTGYQREFLGKPVIEGNMFKHHWFTKYSRLPKLMKRVWMYADPAWGEKGCYKAIISIGYDGNRFYVMDVWVRQTENSRFFRYYYDTYTELSQRYGVRFRAAIETSFGQQRILADFDRWCRETNHHPISHRIRRINNDKNKNLRIERTDTVIETGKVLFPDGQDTPTLISQFLTYPQGYIDGPDALAGCLERFPEYDCGRNRVRVRSFRF
ncbi:MAG: hypothetical protein K8R90_02095 [Candidatus Cloacimonetes bacterium]|nr:hypothetical protein [Candidatus Cloacimonadota bacterium]